MNHLVVIGSINMDIVSRVNQFPLPGETIKSTRTVFNPGGKGANQAVSASKSGGKVTMIGALGSDTFGEELLNTLRNENIQTDYIIRKPGTTGLALIMVDGQGENQIILDEGANGLLDKTNLEQILASVSKEPNMYLLQNEISWESTMFAIDFLDNIHAPIYLNPAPALEVPKHVLSKLTGIFLNEIEAEIITGYPINRETIEVAANKLIESGVKEVIITLGADGCYYRDHSGKSVLTEGYKVDAIDTTAAGDTFIGAYLVSKLEENKIESCLEYATAASAITVSREGAQKSIPYKDEIQAFLEEKKGK